jgi:hypothetical protein
MFEIKGPGSQEEYIFECLLNYISTLYMHRCFFKFFSFLLKRLININIWLASMKTHLLILKIFPKAAAEYMFKLNFYIIGQFCLVSIYNYRRRKKTA